MKTLAKYHVCNHSVIGENHLKIYLSGQVSYRDFRETWSGAELISAFFGISSAKRSSS